MLSHLLNRRKEMPIYKTTMHPFLSLQEVLNQAVDEFYSQAPTKFKSDTEWEKFNLTPAVDIVETAEAFKVEAEVPGLGPEDLKIEINPQSLIIRGEKTASQKDKGKNYVSREIYYGAYQRQIPLSDNLDVDKAKATFKKGMLWVEIPKKKGTPEQTKSLKVEQANS